SNNDLKLDPRLIPACDLAAAADLADFAAGATLLRGQVVARFEPQWNSLWANNTRSINILGSIYWERLMTPEAQFCCIRGRFGQRLPAFARRERQYPAIS